MDILVKNNGIISVAPNISYGVYNESLEKWRLSDEDDKLLFYMIDDGFSLVEDVTLPSDYEGGKYFYENGEFILNEFWKPYRSPEQRMNDLEEENVLLHEEIDNIWNDIATSIENGVNEV